MTFDVWVNDTKIAPKLRNKIDAKHLFSISVLFIFIKNIFPEVPDWQERESNKETQRSSNIGYEGDGRVSPILLFQSAFSAIKAIGEHEISS